MKIVRLSYGLGNEMFQYCIYLQLKKMYPNEDIYVDTGFYDITDYPNDLPKVLGDSLEKFDINNKFKKDSAYFEAIDKFRYWKELGFDSYVNMIRGEKGQLYANLDAKMSYIELPLLYKEKFKGLKIVSPNKEKIENIINEFLNDDRFMDDLKFITGKHSIAEFINKKLRGTVKLKYNLFRMPDVRSRVINQLLSFKRRDWCHYGDRRILISEGDTYYNIFGAPCNLEGVEDEVKKVFKFSPFDDDKNSELSEIILNTESVAIHARVVHFEYGMKDILARDYYSKAVSFIKSRVRKPLSFFVFSDNVDWCKENCDKLGIDGNDVTFIDHNKGENAFRDMQLMSLCKHIVIPNSTFSWWAGFLINNPDKVFVTPYGSWPGTISF